MVNHLQLLFGIWLGTLSLPGEKLPFNFTLENKNDKILMIIHNAEERIVCNEVIEFNDSLFIQLPIFDSEFRVKVSENKMCGTWINHGRKGSPEIPFSAEFNIPFRFQPTKKPAVNINGRWEVWFDAGTPDSSLAIGVFNQFKEKVTGTFLTETGDHRYLEGIVNGDSLMLSVFDGSHCWLYKSQISNEMMNGMQWSGLTYKGVWKAKRNNEIQLRDPEAITHVHDPFAFTLPDLDSNLISLSDARFKDKVVVVQIMGSWCPNCMDETAFLSEYYQKHHDEGLEVIGLAFERFPEFYKARANVLRAANRLNVNYPLLIAGISGKENVIKTLPQLQDFISFPTTIVMDRKGKVQYIHAGFSGPATGKIYENYIDAFDIRIRKLLK